MNCPDIEGLIPGDPKVAEHVATCPECAARLAVVEQIREAFQPEVKMPEDLIQATLDRLESERKRRGPWGVIATFILGLATAGPIALAGYTQVAPEPGGAFALILIVLTATLIITVIEPRVVRHA